MTSYIYFNRCFSMIFRSNIKFKIKSTTVINLPKSFQLLKNSGINSSQNTSSYFTTQVERQNKIGNKKVFREYLIFPILWFSSLLERQSNYGPFLSNYTAIGKYRLENKRSPKRICMSPSFIIDVKNQWHVGIFWKFTTFFTRLE